MLCKSSVKITLKTEKCFRLLALGMRGKKWAPASHCFHQNKINDSTVNSYTYYGNLRLQSTLAVPNIFFSEVHPLVCEMETERLVGRNENISKVTFSCKLFFFFYNLWYRYSSKVVAFWEWRCNCFSFFFLFRKRMTKIWHYLLPWRQHFNTRPAGWNQLQTA